MKFSFIDNDVPLWTNILVIVANVILIMRETIQTYHVFKNNTTESISLYAYIFSVMTSILWLIYSIYKNSMQLAIASIYVIITASSVLALKITHMLKKKEIKEEYDELL